MTAAIQNVGAADYQVPVAQQEQLPVDDYMNEPAVYDAALEEKKEAAGSMKGMVAAGLIALGGLGVAAWKTKSASNYKKQVNILKQEKAALEAKVKDEKGFKAYMSRVISGSWLFKTLWTWPKEGVMKLVNKVKGKAPKVEGK